MIESNDYYQACYMYIYIYMYIDSFSSMSKSQKHSIKTENRVPWGIIGPVSASDWYEACSTNSIYP